MGATSRRDVLGVHFSWGHILQESGCSSKTIGGEEELPACHFSSGVKEETISSFMFARCSGASLSRWNPPRVATMRRLTWHGQERTEGQCASNGIVVLLGFASL